MTKSEKEQTDQQCRESNRINISPPFRRRTASPPTPQSTARDTAGTVGTFHMARGGEVESPRQPAHELDEDSRDERVMTVISGRKLQMMKPTR
jgi:hypothetical protein